MGKGRSRETRGRAARRWWPATVLAVVAAGFVLAWRVQAPPPGVAPDAPGRSAPGVPVVMRRETRPALDPALFVGKAALAHRVAREIPDVLDQFYCYCECDKHVGHRSLLSCYTDGHAAT